MLEVIEGDKPHGILAKAILDIRQAVASDKVSATNMTWHKAQCVLEATTVDLQRAAERLNEAFEKREHYNLYETKLAVLFWLDAADEVGAAEKAADAVKTEKEKAKPSLAPVAKEGPFAGLLKEAKAELELTDGA